MQHSSVESEVRRSCHVNQVVKANNKGVLSTGAAFHDTPPPCYLHSVSSSSFLTLNMTLIRIADSDMSTFEHFTNLPLDLKTQIAVLLDDREDAVNLAVTHSSCTEAGEARTWDSIRIVYDRRSSYKEENSNRLEFEDLSDRLPGVLAAFHAKSTKAKHVRSIEIATWCKTEPLNIHLSRYLTEP